MKNFYNSPSDDPHLRDLEQGRTPGHSQRNRLVMKYVLIAVAIASIITLVGKIIEALS